MATRVIFRHATSVIGLVVLCRAIFGYTRRVVTCRAATLLASNSSSS